MIDNPLSDHARIQELELALTALREERAQLKHENVVLTRERDSHIEKHVAWFEAASEMTKRVAHLTEEREGLREMLRQEAGYYAYGDPERCTKHERIEHGGTHQWACHKQAGHRGACSTHNDCGEISTGGEVCGLPPAHPGLHAWDQKNAVQTFPLQLAALTEVHERLIGGLRKYGRHVYPCALGGDWVGSCSVVPLDAVCDCGLDALLSPREGTPTE